MILWATVYRPECNKCMNKWSSVVNTIPIYLISAQIAITSFFETVGVTVCISRYCCSQTSSVSVYCQYILLCHVFKFSVLCRSSSRSIWGRLHLGGLWSRAEEVSSLTAIFIYHALKCSSNWRYVCRNCTCICKHLLVLQTLIFFELWDYNLSCIL